jgi:hypothetical protein
MTRGVVNRGSLTSLPLELIEHILSFLSWPGDLYPFLFTKKCLNPIAERVLYQNIGDLSAPRAVRLLLSLVNAPPARRELVKALALDFSNNRLLFALERLIYKVLRLLPRLRALSVEVSIHENRHRRLAWIFPLDTSFRLRSFATSIRCVFIIFFSAPPRMRSSVCKDAEPMRQVGPRPCCLPRVTTGDPRPRTTWHTTRIQFGSIHAPSLRPPTSRELPLGARRP